MKNQIMALMVLLCVIIFNPLVKASDQASKDIIGSVIGLGIGGITAGIVTKFHPAYLKSFAVIGALSLVPSVVSKFFPNMKSSSIHVLKTASYAVPMIYAFYNINKIVKNVRGDKGTGFVSGITKEHCEGFLTELRNMTAVYAVQLCSSAGIAIFNCVHQ